MNLFVLKNLRNGITYSKIKGCLIFLNLFLLLLFIISCEKDNKISNTSKPPALTIEKAKEFFAQTQIKEFDTKNRGGDEEEDTGFYMKLGWNNGSEYHDEGFDLDVVEIPILESTLLKKYQVAEGTDITNSYENNGQKEILLFTQNSTGDVKITILKISGTLDYLSENEMKVNTFRNIDSDFEGLVEFYNLKDSLLEDYLVKDGYLHEVVETHEWEEVQTQSEDRWAFCIVGWFTNRPCTGNNHHDCDEKNECPCGVTASCAPPVCAPILVECGGPPLVNLTVHEGIIVEPPGYNWGNNGGGGPGPNNHCGCTKHKIDQYYTNYQPDLDIPFTDDYWFNINHVVIGPNCSNGHFESGTYKVYLVPGQGSNASEITYSVAMDYAALDYKVPLSECQYEVTIDYSGTIEWRAEYTIGPFSFVTQHSHLFLSAPTFTFD